MPMNEQQRKQVAEAMDRPWYPVVDAVANGHRLSIIDLPDFEVFAETREELWAEWRDLLESHLTGYVMIGKMIPMPLAWFRIAEPATTAPAGASVRIQVTSTMTVVGAPEDFAEAAAA